MARRPAVLDQLNIIVRDMDASIDFYRRLGVEIPATLPEWNADHRTAEMGDGIDVDLDSAVFAAKWNTGWPADRAGVVVGFRLESRQDVDSLYHELMDAGYRGQQPPCDAFWGARYAVVEDPSGNSVGLMSPVDPARRSPPPQPPNDRRETSHP